MIGLPTPRGPTSSEATSMFQDKPEHSQSEDDSQPKTSQHFTRLSPADLQIIYQSFGIPIDPESHYPILRKSSIYPPRGLPNGLYTDVLRSRLACQYKYYFIATFFNISLLTQLILGATMTALSATISSSSSLPIVILAAANTVVAGLLALMHNSGLPERYQNDWNEFEKVEIKIKELVETGIVKEGISRDDAVEACFKKYRMARKTVERNRPGAYASSTSLRKGMSSKRTTQST